ncbi:hypothetical protein L3Q82_022065 [Scortum barcoo]|uniref:Uncharacterized protein n=1 Tax=Scortum barcoo TaxID=214431 RepID=A0ACB8X061_9TELE|nr:hypothetical protein L3Q82_022065 [Scortum barcoo]
MQCVQRRDAKIQMSCLQDTITSCVEILHCSSFTDPSSLFLFHFPHRLLSSS